MLFDLHVHTVASDGERSVLEIAEIARRSGLAGFAVTDHDVLPDDDFLGHATQRTGVKILAGIEISTLWRGRGMHLLAYGFDPEASSLVQLSAHLCASRQRRVRRWIERLEGMGIRLNPKEVDTLFRHRAPGRLHVAKALVKSGHSTGPRDAFARWLARGEEWPDRPSIIDAIRAVHAANGIAVLAHPSASLGMEEIAELAGAGLDGVEVAFPQASPARRRSLGEIAHHLGLLRTAGSDYHGGGHRRFLGSETIDLGAPSETGQCMYRGDDAALRRRLGLSAGPRALA